MNDATPSRSVRSDLLRQIAANPVAGSPSAMRAAFARLAGPQPVLKQIEIAGIPCVKAGDGAPGAVWLHGGGYVFGGAESHGNAISHLAKLLGAPVLMPLYPRAPHRTWPAQRDDTLAVLDALPGPLPLIGDSAGGHLALHAAFARPRRISALALLSPNTDRSGLSRTRERNSARDPMNDDAQDTHLGRLALPHADPAGVEASPLLGPLDRLPRTFVSYAENEVLADDGALLVQAAGREGVTVTECVGHDLMHMWHLWPQKLPAAAQSLGRLAQWLRDGH